MAQLVKNRPTMWEIWVPSLGWEDALDKGKVTHSSIMAYRFQGWDNPWGHKELNTTERVSLSLLKKIRKIIRQFRNYLNQIPYITSRSDKKI